MIPSKHAGSTGRFYAELCLHAEEGETGMF